MYKVGLRRSKARAQQNTEVHAEVALWLDDVLARTGTEEIALTARQEQPAPATADVA
jgi:hypothetical protein